MTDMQLSTNAIHPITLSFIQNLKLKIMGVCKVGSINEKGWKDDLPLYAFKCKQHGIVYSTPHGHYMRLICPKCIKKHIETMNNELELIQMVDDYDLVDPQEN